ncbi:dihydrofolate reductase family protein [Bailinhaonella thermotolerans]|uniref:Dihydrofolate reductase n=1 Tax=Bailinhaonella thermotolerans TaxID=1070861 RepID=A0A3A4AXL8_9ACTN|nr:dihydrofolate reductase family protein [Bailinhaonella thermotolerans]RJL24162.1 dihydrofolate reductase [Bailinhaonella thermotolerans]
MEQGFAVSVFVGTSLDGFIAREAGDLGWLVSRGDAAGGDMGYGAFLAGVDTVVMGRATYEKVRSFGEAGWPYDGKRVAVLSSRLAPGEDPRVTVYADFDSMVAGLAAAGAESVYADGGQVVRAFLRAGMVQDMVITTVPVLIGQGIPLFGPVGRDVPLIHRSTEVMGGGLVQSRYSVER